LILELGNGLEGWVEMRMTYMAGPVMAALRTPTPLAGNHCMVVRGASGAGRLMATVGEFLPNFPDRVEYYVQVPITGGKPEVFNTISAELMSGGIGAERSLGETFVAVAKDFGGDVLKVPYDGSPVTPIFWTGQHKPRGDLPKVVGRDVLYWLGKSPPPCHVDVYHDDTGVTETLIAPPGADVYGLQANSQFIVWQQAYPIGSDDSTAERFELWVAPFASSPDRLVPEKLLELPRDLWNSQTHLDGDMLVLRKSWYTGEDMWWSSNVVVRLSDRVYWTVDAPPGLWWDDTMYVTADEIALPLEPPWGNAQVMTIRRQELSALGPPKPLAELANEPPRGGPRPRRPDAAAPANSAGQWPTPTTQTR
jgi:hypothetical protein